MIAASKADPEALAIDDGAVALDYALPFQLLYPAQACRGREPDAIGELDVADPAL